MSKRLQSKKTLFQKVIEFKKTLCQKVIVFKKTLRRKIHNTLLIHNIQSR